MISKSDIKLCVLGLGYVGLPLAVEFGKHIKTIGYDINSSRVDELKLGNDSTLEVDPDELLQASSLTFSDQLSAVADCNVYIVTVPTPVDAHKQPDLSPLKKSSAAIGSVLKRGDIVIYESTVYPGATEEVCVPELEEASGLTFNDGFYVGYSPERINPGDKVHRLPNIVKVTSGSTEKVGDFVDYLYRLIITAGTHKASSIKVAEASKVIENTQRDLNIALVNELAIIFGKVGIDTVEVLEAAGTKWNFLPFRPGLVGGHCIGVDPYYLTHKAQSLGYFPDVILAGRRINDGMGEYVVSSIVKKMIDNAQPISGARALVLGLSFKENCPDIRNTRAVDIVEELKSYHMDVDVYDPWVSSVEAENEYGLSLIEEPQAGSYDVIVLAVAHTEFVEKGASLRLLGKQKHLLYDVKSVLPSDQVDGRL